MRGSGRRHSNTGGNIRLPIPKEIADMIARIKRERPNLSVSAIHMILRLKGYIVGRTSVYRVLKRNGLIKEKGRVHQKRHKSF